MKITLNAKTKSKNAIANFNVDFGNGIEIKRVELINNPKGDNFISKQTSFKDAKGEWVTIPEVFFAKDAEITKTIITEVSKLVQTEVKF